VLKSFIQPLKEEDTTEELKLPMRDQLALLLYRSCLGEVLTSYLTNDSCECWEWKPMSV